MKFGKLLAGIISGVIAATSMAVSASAYLTVPASPASLLTTNSQSWSKMINSSYAIDYSQLAQIQATLTLSDPAAYEAEKASGFFSDGETAFTDFAGNIAFGSTTEWIAFNYDSLADTAGGDGLASVTSLGSGSYIITAPISSTQAANISGRCSVTFAEWGNTSDKYILTIDSFSLVDTNGTVMLQYDGAGNALIEPAVAETTTATEAPVETTTTTTTTEATTTTTTTTTTEATTTTEETTTVPEETAEEASEEETTAAETTTTTTTTTTAAETTIAEETTTAAPATTTAAVQQAVASDSDDFASRNSQLMIFAIAAVVIIVAVIVAFVLISLKKKK